MGQLLFYQTLSSFSGKFSDKIGLGPSSAGNDKKAVDLQPKGKKLRCQNNLSFR